MSNEFCVLRQTMGTKNYNFPFQFTDTEYSLVAKGAKSKTDGAGVVTE